MTLDFSALKVLPCLAYFDLRGFVGVGKKRQNGGEMTCSH